ncbi:MAG: hypothetical protein EOP90_08805 [Lysobacteraceae bacterium]|nr:MAG: hypothetical protein EOP90_08805 [Xanthomonadaceae bacterium]
MTQPRGPAMRERAIGVATAAMCALAGGAIWCLLSLYLRSPLLLFAFAIAMPVAWALRTHGFAGRASGAAIAIACVLLASTYAWSLQAIARIASMLGLPMRSTMNQMGPAMVFDVMRAGVGGWPLTIALAAAVAAAAWVLRPRRAAQEPRR